MLKESSQSKTDYQKLSKNLQITGEKCNNHNAEIIES